MPILSWLTRDEDVKAAAKVPYRLLEEVSDLSYGDKDTGNMLIQGDNLEALKALLPFYAGQVKCIYIDPPYNTKSANFEHYDDNLEHAQWLAMMWPRIELLHSLLAEDGSIWVSLDDNEVHYLKITLDEIFGRKNFVSNAIWQKLYTVKNSAKYLSDMHDHVLCYAKNKEVWRPNLLPRKDSAKSNYQNTDDDSRGPWTTNALQARNYYSLGSYKVVGPTGKTITPPDGTYWRVSEEKFNQLDADKRIWWGKDGSAAPRVKKFLSEAKQGVVPATLWLHQDAGTNAEAKQEVRSLSLNDGDVFTTPKPEKLMQHILTLASNEHDLVLDSFIGSATTNAVAHKMNRRYIGIEMGEHAVTHCQPRLQKVVDGEQGGISKAVNWQGGGGFRFYRLGERAFDENGQICADIRFPVLAAHIWFAETNTPWNGSGESPAIGIHDDKAYALLYNGILGDKRLQGGNVLTSRTLKIIKEALVEVDPLFAGNLVIYGESSRLGDGRLKAENITFKQTPYDVKAR